MAVNHASWVHLSGNPFLQSSGWLATDTAFKVDEQLQAWVTALADPDIVIQDTPNTGTSKTSYTGWMIRMNHQAATAETEMPYGFCYGFRYGNTSTSNVPWVSYYNWTDSTSNYGYGSFSQLYTRTRYHEAYASYDWWNDVVWEATGSNPYFCWFSADTGRSSGTWMRGLFKLDISALNSESYYPQDGYTPWVYIVENLGHTSQFGSAYLMSTATDSNQPYKGNIVNVNSTYFDYPYSGTNVLYPWWRPIYGHSHYMGTLTKDLYIGPVNIGGYGDTTVINSRTFMNFGCGRWMPIE